MGEVTGRIYKPNNVRNHPAALLYLHGGGWIMGKLNSHEQVRDGFSLRCKITVIALDYALEPEKQVRSAHNTSISVYIVIIQNKKWLGHA